MTQLKTIAHIRSDFGQKFGIPRQSGVAEDLRASIVFEPAYRNGEALRGLEEFSHIWLIWGFSEAHREAWSPTVRPPRLGGNKRLGVFATRAPYRPNPLGLSCVQVERIRHDTPDGPTIEVLGADLMDGSPIYDIKPYLPYTDSHPTARGGFAAQAPEARLQVELGEQHAALLPPGKAEALREVLALDPRPRYQDDAARVYGMNFAGCEVRFTVAGDTLRVCAITSAAGTES